MEILRELEQSPATAEGHAITIGAYDGVHLGHLAVIEATRERAQRLGVKTGLVTFDPHPAYVLRPDSAPPLLTDLDQKLDLLEAAGVDTVVVVPFDERRAEETAEAFVETAIVGALGARAVVVGRDFHFGKDRAGNVELLAKLGEHHGFEVEGVQLLPLSSGATDAVSSTVIRGALAAGEVAKAASLLGRCHELRGPVASGDQRGRTIGFPTANVAIGKEMAMPADAVYAGWYIRPDGSRWPSAINIGKRPTFYRDAEHSLLEAHLIGFEGDLYDEQARVQIVEMLRPEQRFDGIEQLTKQLKLDISKADELLARAG